MKQTAKITLLLLGASVLGSAATILATSAFNNDNDDNFVQEIHSTSNVDTQGHFIRTSASAAFDTDFTIAAEKSVNAVVCIKSYATPRSTRQQFIDPFEFFFGPGYGNRGQRQQQDATPQPLGLGSGVIITSNGYIVTNNHVIEGAEKLEVTLNDNSTYNATIIGTDASSDIALLKIDGKDLPTIPFGDSDALKVGEWVLAVGNPFGFTSTVTAGIVSAKARSISSATHGRPMGIESYIQTDAAVNKGNSGGALVNTNGELVGINTAIYSQTGDYAGCSFAIPSALVKKIVTDIQQYGTVQRAVLGISYIELNADMAREKDITATKEGIYVAEVSEQSAAMEAGIKEGDVIIKLGGNPVKNSGQMMEQMNKLRPGDTVEIIYVRDNKTHTTKATMKNNQGGTTVTKATDFTSLGCAFKKPSDSLKQSLGINSGVQVSGLKSGKFKEAGIKDGFIILDINGQRIKSQDDVEAIYNSIINSNDNDKVMFITGVYPTKVKRYYAVDLSE